MNRGSIRQRFSVVFALLILFPALALGLVTVRVVHTSTVAQGEHQQLMILQAMKSNVVDRRVEDMESALRTLARDPRLPEVVDDDAGRARVLEGWELTRSLVPDRSWIYFGSSRNEIVVSPEWQAPEGYDCRERPWYRQARHADDVVWVNPYAEYITSDIR